MQNAIRLRDAVTRYVDQNSFYAKNNDMISKLAMFELSELRLIAFILAHYDSRKTDNLAFSASVADLMRVFPLSKKSAYNVVKEAVKGINSKPFELNSDCEEELIYWFRGLRHVKGSGQFVFMINPDIEEHFLGLKGNFTKIKIDDVARFKAKTTWQLYENLKMHSRPKKEVIWSCGLYELRSFFGVRDDQYKAWFDFRKRCLDCSVKEINTFSDLEVGFQPKRKGRSIARVDFTINVKSRESQFSDANLSPQEELSRILVAHGLPISIAIELSKIAEKLDRIEFTHLKVVEVQNRYSELPNSRKRSYSRYLEAALRSELNDDEVPEYAESLECWQKKGRGLCETRKRGTPGKNKKCRICFEYLPINSWGV